MCQIADKLHISQPTVSRILKKHGFSGKYLDTKPETKEDKPMKAAQINEEFDKAVDEMIAEAKEKEPASSANDTSSEVRNSPNISTSNDTIEPQKSQALSMIEVLNIVEGAVINAYGREAEPTYLHADRSTGEYRFILDGREYAVCFGERLGTELEYGRNKKCQ